MISLKSLRKSYPSQQAVLKDVNISLSDTGFYLLLGESGSGKTTFLNVLAGMLPFDEGSIEWNGESFYGQMPEMLHGEAEYMTQEAFFADFLSVSENLKVLGIDESTADEYLMRFGLAGKNDQYPPTLSGGERQRLSLARALIKGRKVLLLDEPTAALDADNKKKVFELLKKMSENILILCATHDSYAKDFADIILMFDKGAGRVEAEVQRSVNSGPTDESISEKSISVKLNNNETMSMRDALRYLSKWFHSGRRERFSYYAFIIFMTLSLSMICFADTPTHKSDITMKNLYRLNMCKLTLHGELDVNAVLPEDSRIRSLILNYSGSCPDGVEKTPDIYMYDLPEYELVLNVLPDDSALCPISQRIRYGTWFTGPDQIILSPAMAEGLMGEHAERLIGSSIVRNLYQRGEVSLQIVGITEELNDAERIWLGAAGVLQIDYGERVNPENERDLFYAGAAIMDGYRNDESFHTDSNGWQQVWFLFFKDYAAMDSFYQEYAGKMSETYGFNCRLEKAGLPIDYDLKWPLVSGILLIAAAFTVLLTGLFYGDLRRKEFQYNSRFLAVFEYAGFKKTKLLSALTTLSLWELMKQFLTALGLTLVLTVCVNLLNHKKFLLPLEIFSFNPVLLGASVLLLFGIAYTVLRISFRRFRMMSWYGYLSASRDLL